MQGCTFKIGDLEKYLREQLVVFMLNVKVI